MKVIVFSKDPQGTLGRFPANVARLILTRLDQYASEPAARSKTLKRARRRQALGAGERRVLFTEDARSSRSSRSPTVSRQTIGILAGGMSVQIITSPLGKRLIVLPARDCENPVAAIEDREDSAAVAIFRRRLAVGEEEWFPWR